MSTWFRGAFAILIGLFLLALAFGTGFVVASQNGGGASARLSVGANDLADEPTSRFELAEALELFDEAWGLVKRDFYGPLPPSRTQIYAAARGLLSTLNDPYTVFVEPIPRRFEQDDLRGSYGGIGADLQRNEAGQVVLTPFPESPATKAGIIEGDVLVAIDDLLITSEMDIAGQVAARLRGEVGTEVRLRILRTGENLELTVVRQVIEVPSVTWRMIEEAPTLAYLQITSFSDRTPGELRKAVDELQAQNPRGLVLDLRNNGGGLLQSSVDVADEFLAGGVVLYESRRGQDEKVYRAEAGGVAVDIPLVVLVNGGTASASEIVAGAIQDRARGILVGETTFGKGSVQLIFDLSDGSSLHVTAARWYTPEHHVIDGVGLQPDLVVEVDPGDESDNQLTSAIEFLQSHSRSTVQN